MLALLLTTAFASNALAQSWQATFDSAAVASQIQGQQLKVLVAAAGANKAEVDAAAAALENSLRRGGRTQLVMSDDALGSLAAADDASILAKVKKLPVEQVFVVRVFPGGDGAADTVVVTMYESAKGEMIGAFSGSMGKAIAGKESAQGAAEGVTAHAVKAVDSVTKEKQSSGKSAKDQYDERYIWFEDMAMVNVNAGVVVSQRAVPYRGKYKESLAGDKFYDYVGRADLAEQYRSRIFKHYVMGWPGLMLIAVGTSVTTWGFVGPMMDEKADTSAMMLIGGGASVVGGIALTALGLGDPNPVAAPEARRMADEYNAKLRAELGLGEESAERSPAPERAPTESSGMAFSIAPLPVPQGGGLALSFTFQPAHARGSSRSHPLARRPCIKRPSRAYRGAATEPVQPGGALRGVYFGGAWLWLGALREP